MCLRTAYSKSALKLAAIAATAFGLLSACADGSNLPPPNFATNDAASSPRIYKIGIGDKLKVTVFGEENLSGQFEVNTLGNISMPLVGEIPAKGLPLEAFRDSTTRRLASGYLKNPRVSVEVLNYRPIFVHGEVRSGGEFQFKNGIKLRDAIAMAGGYTYRANTNYVIIAREGEPEARLPLPTNIPVLPGDNIRVPERFF